MAIKTSTFGRVEISGKEAARFVRHMEEDKSNKAAQTALVRGRGGRAISGAVKFSTRTVAAK